MKKLIFLCVWLFSILVTILFTFENTETIEALKGKLKIYKTFSKIDDSEIDNNKTLFTSNHFSIEINKIVEVNDKTAFLLNNSTHKNFNTNNIEIFTQRGFKLLKNNNIPLLFNKNFTQDFNGGLKSVFFVNKKPYGLISSLDGDCYYASIVDLSNKNELFKTVCLKLEEGSSIDFNGIGGASIHINDEILISLGTPTSDSKLINELAQNSNSFIGKTIKIKNIEFNKKNINPEIYSLGHRNPQGITKLNNLIFAVEHGPFGGDELNLIKYKYNYGWPKVSYGTRYGYDNNGKSYLLSHEKKGFEEPLFAFVPSVGISSLNVCPSKLTNYYKKNCLMATSLYGNALRPGKSLIIFLLDDSFKKVNSIEKINLDIPLRHFMTNEKNELYEDENGNIYISSDFNGIYRVNFNNFAR